MRDDQFEDAFLAHSESGELVEDDGTDSDGRLG
jgi:hypothetical protein